LFVKELEMVGNDEVIEVDALVVIVVVAAIVIRIVNVKNGMKLLAYQHW
jgi:hypothetical protein